MENTKNRLEEIAEQSDNHLIKSVINDYILNQYEDDQYLESYIKDIINYGCISGVVSGMIYYKETYAFFDNFYDEIEEIRHHYESEIIGEPIKIKGDLKNFLAWFAFESVVYDLFIQLEL